jgi:predicted nucleotide-binding protein
MNNVPSHQGKDQQPPSAAGSSVLSISQAEAETQLNERIAAGQEMQRFQLGRERSLAPLERRITRWRELNQEWLDRILGGEAAEEYRIAAANHDFVLVNVYARNDLKRPDLDREITILQSIKYRLYTWVPRSDVMSPGFNAQTSQDAPIFIVHGSDTLRAESVAHTVTSATGRRTIILRDEPNLGRTLIEKFEQHAAEVSYAIIVLTADDKGSRADETDTRPRGRQNVIFEMGYFFGFIGRGNVSVLLRPGVEKPSDMAGIAYITFDDNRAWKAELLRELRHAGFDVQL